MFYVKYIIIIIIIKDFYSPKDVVFTCLQFKQNTPNIFIKYFFWW